MEVLVSDNGKDFKKVIRLDQTIPASITTELIHEFNADFETLEARYVKVIARNYGSLPEWHSGAGNDSWLFVDEIIIE